MGGTGSKDKEPDQYAAKAAWKSVAVTEAQRNPGISLVGLQQKMRNPITNELCSELPKNHRCRHIALRVYLKAQKQPAPVVKQRPVAGPQQQGRICQSDQMDRSGWTRSACDNVRGADSQTQLHTQMTNFLGQRCTDMPPTDDCFRIADRVWRDNDRM